MIGRGILAFAVTMMVFGLGTARADDAALPCPADVRDAVSTACPCDGFPNHGQYVRCVRKELRGLRKAGCDPQGFAGVTRCASRSTCGKPRNPIVCCARNGKAKLAKAEKCTARGGLVMPGITSVCDAECPTPP